MLAAGKKIKRKMGRGELISIDSVEELVGICPRDIVGISNAKEVLVVLFGKGVDFPVPRPKGVDKRGNSYFELFLEVFLGKEELLFGVNML